MTHFASELRICLVLAHLFLFVAHATPFVIEHLILALGEALVLVIHEELLSDSTPLLLLCQTVHATVDAAIVYNRANLEVLGQRRTIIGLIEALRKDLISHLNGFQIHLELFCHFDLRHASPSLACILYTLHFPCFLVERDAIDGLQLLGVGSNLARGKEGVLSEELLSFAALRLLNIVCPDLLGLRLREERSVPVKRGLCERHIFLLKYAKQGVRETFFDRRGNRDDIRLVTQFLIIVATLRVDDSLFLFLIAHENVELFVSFGCHIKTEC